MENLVNFIAKIVFIVLYFYCRYKSQIKNMIDCKVCSGKHPKTVFYQFLTHQCKENEINKSLTFEIHKYKFDCQKCQQLRHCRIHFLSKKKDTPRNFSEQCTGTYTSFNKI